ncbi:MAG: valine--tRNA ligase [Bacteroidetes bacterium]|nr:valine--tRNA ligase [Bacteroidota bacterium]MBT6687302.1 valine--tRNA ligase [Bacteroidota bacterium]MBT7143966.1 valine--tRNA ligase [Bacteroidota bacterium]MBT7491121.1 valine--tRNA ligase [Bacteroidota bacterium]
MNIPTKYEPSKTEEKWYKFWQEQGFFKSKPDERKAYTNVIPPPNVTGVLHMGHMLNNTIQDILVRRARMLGYNACWVPGTDHASIATEAKVVAKLKEMGIEKNDISREEFLKHAWEWKEKHGGIILEQLKKLGASCDWDRTKFTMDKDLSESVIDVFIDLFKKDRIYRGVRMVNWDPSAQTAVSDEEVIHREVQSKLYYINYSIVGLDGHITIATTRPETILGDTAVCINPNDDRFKQLAGKRAIVPLINREIPIILDEYVDMEFGTGALKITPAHDINDYEIGIKHNLETVDILNDDGTLNENAQIFIGKDRAEARDLVYKELEKNGKILKIEDYINKVGFSERTDAVIEPKLSMQWFLKMQELSQPALENVMNDNVKIYPAKFKNTYKHWMDNVKDWCISRQLWWGHRIPAYFLPNSNEYVIAKNIDEALILAKEKLVSQGIENPEISANDLRQDDDVLDTWFSSWLWPISVFDGIRNPENEDIKYYYPTNDLVTAPEILFFWVARMIIAGYEYIGKKPFSNVYLTGIVRDNLRRKMSKSLGNSPDPLELIKKYSADGVRVGMLLCSPAGGDLLFNENLTEQGRNFGNKIWNAFRLIKNWEIDENIPQPESAQIAIEWFENQLNKNIKLIDEHFSKFRLSDALMLVYKLFWDEFSSWYLELIKPQYQKPIDSKTYFATIGFFDKLLKLLHPFMPFISEEIWQLIEERKNGESIMIEKMPEAKSYDNSFVAKFEDTKEIITNIRKIRKDKNLPNKEKLSLLIKTEENSYNKTFNPIIQKSAILENINFTTEKIDGAISFIVKNNEFYVPLGNLVDTEEELKKLEVDLEYSKKFLTSVNKKLSNKKFVENAPEKVVNIELKKQKDAEQKIKTLEERILSLGSK